MRGCVWVVLFGVLGCARVPGDGEPLVVTTTLLADAVRTIVQEDMPVEVLMGPGVDPHLYKPTAQDGERLQRARAVIAHGLRLEGKMETVLRSLARQKPVIFAAELLPRESLRQVGPEQYDPHVWFDVRLWRELVLRLADTLAALFPQWGTQWRERARQYAQELTRLDQWIRQQLQRIPAQRRVLVTIHDAFAYFGRAYGMETVALQGVSTVAEFGLHDVVRVAELIERRQVPAVFVESTLPARLMDNVVQMVRLRGGSVRIAGELFSDALGAPGSGAETYVGMMQSNVRRIVGGLAGDSLP